MENIFNDSFHIYRYWHNKNTEFNNLESIDWHSFRSVDEGKVVVNCQGRTITATKGDLFYLPAGRYTTMNFFAEPNCHGTVIRLAFLPEVNLLGYPPQVIKASEIKKLFDDVPIINAYEDGVTNNVVWKTYRFLDAFHSKAIKHTDRHSIKIQKALEYMKENDNYTINDVAKYCDISERRLRAAFTKILGTSPIQIKQRFQAVKADTLLKTTDLSIEEIANIVGFYSTNQLRNVIKKRYSALPKQLRNTK